MLRHDPHTSNAMARSSFTEASMYHVLVLMSKRWAIALPNTSVPICAHGNPHNHVSGIANDGVHPYKKQYLPKPVLESPVERPRCRRSLGRSQPHPVQEKAGRQHTVDAHGAVV